MLSNNESVSAVDQVDPTDGLLSKRCSLGNAHAFRMVTSIDSLVNLKKLIITNERASSLRLAQRA